MRQWGIPTHTAAGILSERLSKVSYLTGLCKKTFHMSSELKFMTVQKKNHPNLTKDEHVPSAVDSCLVE